MADILPHVLIINAVADALEIEGLLPKEITVTRNKSRFKVPTILAETIVPETSGSTGKDANEYIIYKMERDDREDTERTKHETMSFTTYTATHASGMAIKNAIRELLGRRDFSARTLEEYQDYIGNFQYVFYDVEFYHISGPEKLNRDDFSGGLYNAVIVIRYRYSEDVDFEGRKR